MEIKAYSPDHGLYELLTRFSAELRGNEERVVEQQSRNGPVIRAVAPTVIAWVHPRTRVSFNAERDANPVFHLVEAFWMLAGRNDVKTPSYFASNLANYSDDGVTLAAAYGHRWREHYGHDQIQYVINALSKNPNDRRAVIGIWDGVTDVQNGMEGGKDLACNLSVAFDASQGFLDMTVYNRSNDLIWGATGANVVHFSFLMEYVAGAIGIPMGTYYQVSCNSHIYTDFPVTKKLATYASGSLDVKMIFDNDDLRYPYATVPMYMDEVGRAYEMKSLDEDMETLLQNYNKVESIEDAQKRYTTVFFRKVVAPCVLAFNLYKADDLETALSALEGNVDWVVATRRWIQRRLDKRNAA